jgi:pyridoxal phosphate enzyme (YggS family)
MKPNPNIQNPTEGQPTGATNGAPDVVCASSSVQQRFDAVKTCIFEACIRAGRDPDEIALVAVSKTQTVAAVQALATLGQLAFAENYLQEALQKIDALKECGYPLTWHFIGPIQSNKTKPIAENFSWVHSVDRLKVAQRLSEQRPTKLPDLQICLQVNTSKEEQKSGLTAEQVLPLAKQISDLPRLRLRGLMCIPRPPEQADPHEDYEAMRSLLTALRTSLPAEVANHVDTLSMGMSADLQAAISSGSTMVRIGTALFGARL